MRLGLLLALTALAASFAPPALAADVTVAPAGGEPVELSLAELQPDVVEQPYATGPVTGVSIDRLLDRAGVDPFGFAGATVSAGDQAIELSREELIATGERRPVFWLGAEGPHFLREDSMLTGELTVTLAALGSLRVAGRASRKRAEAGDRITFTADVEGAAPGEAVRVRWSFDDGESATGTRVRHRFEEAGTYKVVVGATSDANPTGDSAIVTVRIGEPTGGPDREGGGTNEDEDAPDSGAATGSDDGEDEGEERDDRAAAGERRRRAAARAGRERRRRAAAEADRGDDVEGVLIDAASPPPATQAAARTGTPQAAAPAELSLPPEALIGIAALVMLGYGAARERRGRVTA